MKEHLLKIYDNTIIPEGAEMLNARGFLHVARMMGEQWAGTRKPDVLHSKCRRNPAGMRNRRGRFGKV